MPPLNSVRLSYRRLAEADLDAFSALARDAHVRRFLLDGEVVSRDWCIAQLRASDVLFASQAVAVWLVSRRETKPIDERAEPIGFCGFIRFEETGPEPQLLYALVEAYTGQGLATEIARALVEYVQGNTAMTEIHSAVDEPNVASSRVLAKLGFRPTHTSSGAFGKIQHYLLELGRPV